MNTHDRRHPHQPFDPSILADFLCGHDLVAADLLPQGKCNSNYKLRFADGETLVLRLRSRGDADREAFVIGLVRDIVPVPVEVARGDSWSLYPFLPGEHLSEAPDATGAAAEALARIASIPFPSSGWINPDGTVSPFSFGEGEEATDDFLGAMLAREDVISWLGTDAAQALREVMRQEEGRMAEGFAETRLVHGDFNPTNILVRGGAVSGVLDWEFAHAGTPYMDIGNLVRHTDPARYGDIRQGLLRGGLRVRADWLDLAALIDVSSQVEFLTSARSDAFKGQCVARIHGMIARFRR